MKTRNPCDGKLHATVAGSWVDVSIYIAVLVKPMLVRESRENQCVCVCETARYVKAEFQGDWVVLRLDLQQTVGFVIIRSYKKRIV